MDSGTSIVATNLSTLQRKTVVSNTATTATNGQTVFTTPDSSDAVITIFINGIQQDLSAYSITTSTSITLSAGVESGDVLNAVVMKIII